MSFEQPGARNGRTAVVLLVVAIFVATALAIALVAGAASQSSHPSGDVLVPGPGVTRDTPVGKVVIAAHRSTSDRTSERIGEVLHARPGSPPHPPGI